MTTDPASIDATTPPASIAPVPLERRTLSALDVGILWNDLSLGLLVLVTGGILAELGLGAASAAIAIGTVLGCLPLAAVALAGAREGLPAMVLFRPVLGRSGSVLPSILNVAQLLGWTAVEFWAMGRLAHAISERYLGIDTSWPWLAAVAIGCTLLAIGGPVLVVKRFLERFGTWIVLASGIAITVSVVTSGALAEALRSPAEGGLPFWLAVDLVIVMPVSWLPLVADSTRFSRSERGVLGATLVGYGLGNAWFYAIGALLVLAGSAADVQGIGSSIAGLTGGLLLVAGLLVGEAPNAFANIYSGAVSTLNVVPRASATALSIVVGAIAFLLALAFTMERYEVFLFLIGSVFVPLAAIFLADYFVLARGRYGADTVFGPAAAGMRWRAMVPWVAGFVLYHWSVPTGPDRWIGAVERVFSGLGLPFPLLGSRLGASLPSFVLAFLLALVVLPRRSGSRRPGEVVTG
jgi:putative hydroxymethylpyrimidine transporter CytX